MQSYSLRAGAGEVAGSVPSGRHGGKAYASNGLQRRLKPNLQLMLVHRSPDDVHLEPSPATGIGSDTHHDEGAVLQLQPQLTEVRPHMGAADAAAP